MWPLLVASSWILFVQIRMYTSVFWWNRIELNPIEIRSHNVSDSSSNNNNLYFFFAFSVLRQIPHKCHMVNRKKKVKIKNIFGSLLLLLLCIDGFDQWSFDREFLFFFFFSFYAFVLSKNMDIGVFGLVLIWWAWENFTGASKIVSIRFNNLMNYGIQI